MHTLEFEYLYFNTYIYKIYIFYFPLSIFSHQMYNYFYFFIIIICFNCHSDYCSLNVQYVKLTIFQIHTQN